MIREIDFRRNNFVVSADYKTLPDNQPPQIIKQGHGRVALILIPGVYSGNDPFGAFIARNESKYKFYVVTPPGLNGTPARPLLRIIAWASAALLMSFALTMAIALGIKAPLGYGVFTAVSGALLLGAVANPGLAQRSEANLAPNQVADINKIRPTL